MLTLAVILILIWVFGLAAHIGGGLINILVVVALVLFIVNQLSDRP